MFFMIKSFFGLIFLAVIGYGVFVVDMGGQTFASHVADIWRAPIVQKKLSWLKMEWAKTSPKKSTKPKKSSPKKPKKNFEKN